MGEDGERTLWSYRVLSLKELMQMLDRLDTSQLMGFTEILYSFKWMKIGVSAMPYFTSVAHFEALVLPKDLKLTIRSWAAVWEESLKSFDLHVSQKHLERLDELLKSDHATFRQFSEWAEELARRVSDELDLQLFIRIDLDKSKYLKQLNLFGDGVHNNFSSCNFDIEEAGDCLAFHKNTACVFHLMRVIEGGLRILGLSLNDSMLDPKTNPSWDRILKRCDSELQKNYKDRSQVWRQDNEFFSNATANLRAVKDAWRNPTMHVEGIYDNERALEVYNAVRAFMRHLATKLHE